MAFIHPRRERSAGDRRPRRSSTPRVRLPAPQFQPCCSAPSPVKRFGDSVARDTHYSDCPVPGWLAETFGGTPA
jgi:hypothetical protein